VKTLLAVAAAALLAFGLVACGGGDDGSTGSTATSSGARGTITTAPESADSGGNEKQSGDDSGSDEGSAAFRSPGGDNSIQNFGDEVDPEEREAAEVALIAYLEARADGEWGESCEYLAEAATTPLEQLAESSPKLKGKSCAAIVAALSSQLPTSSRENPVTDGIVSLRVEGDRGFALFHGPKGVDYFVPMVEEDGEWKVGALAPSEFP
jgi:hypothetical protein